MDSPVPIFFAICGSLQLFDGILVRRTHQCPARFQPESFDDPEFPVLQHSDLSQCFCYAAFSLFIRMLSLVAPYVLEQDITLYDIEIRDVDAWEGRGTPLQVSLGVTETLGTGSHGPAVSVSSVQGLSFAALGVGDGVKDSNMAFIANLDDANVALSTLTIHTTADDRAIAASGVLSIGACDSGEWTGAGRDGAGGWDWGDRCQDQGWVERNITYGYRMGTLPILERVWPAAAPLGGGLAIEVGSIRSLGPCQLSLPRCPRLYSRTLDFEFGPPHCLHT